MRIERVIEFVEENRQLGNWIIRLPSMLCVIQTDADDFLGVSHSRGIFDARLVEKQIRLSLCDRFFDQGHQPLIPLLDQIVGRPRSHSLKCLGSTIDLENTAIRADTEAGYAVAAIVQNRQSTGHLGRCQALDSSTGPRSRLGRPGKHWRRERSTANECGSLEKIAPIAGHDGVLTSCSVIIKLPAFYRPP